MPGSQDRRSVIVTGPSRGIGRGIALRLAADGLNGALARTRTQ